MIYVVPRLSVMFLDTGQGMPWMARILSIISRLMSSFQGLLAIFIPVGVVIGVALWIPDRVKEFMARTLFKIPVWGNVLKKGMLARFTKTLAMLLTGGVPIHPRPAGGLGCARPPNLP